jgi:hypothetical protein
MSDSGRKLGRVVFMGLPPFSLLARTLVAALVVAASLTPELPLANAAAPADGGYRLAGTVAVGSDYLAFLQVPDGGQVLVRKGSVVNGVKVVSVTSDAIRIALPSGVMELSLEGSGKPQGATPSAAIIEASNDDKNRVYNREVSADQLSRELAVPAGGAAAKSSSASGLVAAQRIAAVLDLPAGSKVLRVHEEPVSSAEGAISQLQKAFASQSGGVVTLDVQTPTGPGRVYLMRDHH